MFPEGFYSWKTGNNLYERLCSCFPWRVHRRLQGPTPHPTQPLTCSTAGRSRCHSHTPTFFSRSFWYLAQVSAPWTLISLCSPGAPALPQGLAGKGPPADDCHMAHTSRPKVDVITAQHFLSLPFLLFHHVDFFHLRPVS